MEKGFTENWFAHFLIDKRYRIYRHLMILGYILLVFYSSQTPKEFCGNYNFYYKFMWIIFFLLMVYINMYLLIPKLMFKGKYITYVLVLIVMIMAGYLLVIKRLNTNYFDVYRLTPTKVYASIFHELLSVTNLLMLLVFSSTSVKLFQQWNRDTTRINELEKNSLQVELRELKNQINPHFLFNMLNNVNVLVAKDPAKASLIIMKLSDFLRHQLYDDSGQSVLLLSEIQFLDDFMELEKIRRDDFNFTCIIENKSSDKNAVQNLRIFPNLFITFIENALKHSIDPDNPSQIDVLFSLNDKDLSFVCINTKALEPVKKRESGGLGLSNIRRRLELLYGKGFNITIEDLKIQYKVTLILPL